ncbi:MAG: hypothetical protein M3N02_05190 [Pseudomonadota bacterium]|nr:hypothetical protein [Pseudomonadota bacterium]
MDDQEAKSHSQKWHSNILIKDANKASARRPPDLASGVVARHVHRELFTILQRGSGSHMKRVAQGFAYKRVHNKTCSEFWRDGHASHFLLSRSSDLRGVKPLVDRFQIAREHLHTVTIFYAVQCEPKKYG